MTDNFVRQPTKTRHAIRPVIPENRNSRPNPRGTRIAPSQCAELHNFVKHRIG